MKIIVFYVYVHCGDEEMEYKAMIKKLEKSEHTRKFQRQTLFRFLRREHWFLFDNWVISVLLQEPSVFTMLDILSILTNLAKFSFFEPETLNF